MKNIKIFGVLLAALVALSGCTKSDNNGGNKEEGKGTLVGQWHMVTWYGATATADIYISFTEEGTFDLYQRIYSPAYEHYSGTYTYHNNVLSGKYSDNQPWASEYDAFFSTDGRMTLTSTSSTSDISVYEKTTIPDEILSGMLTPSTQSRANEESFRFL
ncbi:lipocalin family protein [uncultured Alistipes sp.]|uniref:lipocalin family protein n=1 Tax=uncultured Alistipes sp. TaxID=538949 RepID=UPI002639C031|nr:lipocalin family protein [uncultured Alistipes sp.]